MGASKCGGLCVASKIGGLWWRWAYMGSMNMGRGGVLRGVRGCPVYFFATLVVRCLGVNLNGVSVHQVMYGAVIQGSLSWAYAQDLNRVWLLHTLAPRARLGQ